jgi:transcriptional regulator with XRE-family HTH domain
MREMSLGERLQSILEQRGLTQGQLALKSKVPQSHISMIINEQRTPGIDVAVKLARALDVSLDWLAGLPPREKSVLTPDEEELLRLYRALETNMRATLLDVARSLTGTKRG